MSDQFTRNRIFTVVWAALAAFLTYSFIYAFRKPLSAATFEGMTVFGMSYKAVVIITYVIGYMSAKGFGIKIISELPNVGRRRFLLILILVSWLGLLLFAITPAPYNIVWVFMNGFPLGLMWGILFSYIEGRNSTDILATFLCVSFIYSSGIVKSIGQWLVVSMGVSEFWMPFIVGAMGFPFLLMASWMLEQIPPPSEADKASRSERVPLDSAGRKALFSQFRVGLIAVFALNVVLTICRDIKDNFMVDIWQSLNVTANSNTGVYAQIETLVSIVILVLLAGVVLIKNSKYALKSLHFIIAAGLLLVMGSTYMYTSGQMSAIVWMVLHGVGLYLSYIAFQSVYYERFIAAFQVKGNVGYLIYLADFIGYIGSVTILLLKEFVGFDVQWDVFFIYMSYATCVVGILTMVVAHVYFSWKMRAVEGV